MCIFKAEKVIFFRHLLDFDFPKLDVNLKNIGKIVTGFI